MLCKQEKFCEYSFSKKLSKSKTRDRADAANGVHGCSFSSFNDVPKEQELYTEMDKFGDEKTVINHKMKVGKLLAGMSSNCRLYISYAAYDLHC